MNAASTEDAGGSPARGAIPETIASRPARTAVPAHRREVVDDLAAGASAGPRVGPVATDRTSARRPEVAVFVVDLDRPGVTRLPGFEALGMRGSASGRLHLDGVVVPVTGWSPGVPRTEPTRAGRRRRLVRPRNGRGVPRDRGGRPPRRRPLGGRPAAGRRIDGGRRPADGPGPDRPA